MNYNDDENSKEIELNAVLIDINNNTSQNKEFIEQKDQKKIKSIFLDDNIINKILFIWNIKSTYFQKEKNVQDYNFIYYPLINSYNKKKLSNKFLYFTFFSFYKRVLGRNKFVIFITIFLAILSGVLDFVQYILFKNFLSIIKLDKIYDDSYYYYFGLKFVIFKFFHVIILKNLYFYENYLPIKISNEIINLIYQKIIILTEEHSKDKLLGKIINLIQTDVENIAFIFNYGPSSLVVPIQICMVLFNLYQYYNDLKLLFVLILILVICFIFAFIIQKRYIKSNAEYLNHKDIRIHSTNEIFNNLKEIKMNNLENFFENIIDKKRKTELYHYNSIMNQGIANEFLFYTMGAFMTIGLLLYIRLNINSDNYYLIQADIIITIILMFNKLIYPLYRFPVFITGLIDCYVSGKRIIAFFNTTESKNTLYENINIDNKNICILGPNGGGKTTFIKNLIKNKLSSNNKLSYCSQEKFILDDTIRENILFGNHFDQEKYLAVLEDSQLAKDINNFKEKDFKECKMNGIQLSGGQKSRVDLARAIYNDSQFYFFDDLFVSYDDKVRLNIYNNIFIKKLKKENKNIVASFSNINFLDKNNIKIFDYFIIIDNKQIIFKADYDTFVNSEFYSNLKNSSKNDITSSHVEEKLQKIENDEKNKKKENKKYYESKIKKAMKEIGCYFCFGLIFYEVTYQILELYKIKYILYNFKEFDKYGVKILDHYLMICFINVFFNFMIKHTLYKATYNLNKKISKKILNRILSMPLFSFLQLSKSSDIINRLSRDVEKIKYPMKFLQYVLRDTLGIIIISIYSIEYSIILLILVIINIILSFILFTYFIDRAKLYNNLERDSHSPLINLFSESLTGNLYIQVYNKSNYFNSLLDKRLDNVLKMNIFKYGAMAMFQMYHELLCVFNLCIIILYCIITKYVKNEIDKENISILLTFSINLIETLYSLFFSILNMSLNKIYFDRLLQYENTEQEVNLVNINRIVPFSYGDIKFENISMKYKINSELILKNINIEIKIGEKIAIIGRTGSGKSSLILCLLRIIQNNGLINGNITINGISINNYDLNELRKNISVISQKPFIFNDCSIKENIDPNNIIKDNKVLLNKVQKFQFMKKFINKYIKRPKDLEQKIINLSLSEGEKQIICLSRIMIQNNKIIVMDEATSNIDLETEKLIYDDFINLISKDTTIISILHKLEYLKYYDKVIEISDDGKIKNKN